MRTPTVLVTLMIIDYIFQEFFQLIGLDVIAGEFLTENPLKNDGFLLKNAENPSKMKVFAQK